MEYLGYSLSPFINDLPELRKEYHGARKGSEIPIADEKRMDVLEDFAQVLESSKSPSELVYRSSIYFGCRGGCGSSLLMPKKIKAILDAMAPKTPSSSALIIISQSHYRIREPHSTATR